MTRTRSSEETSYLRMHLVEHLAALASKEVIQSILVAESLEELVKVRICHFSCPQKKQEVVR